MPELLLHPRTKLALDGIVASGTHAVLLQAPAGSGKYAAAIHLAQRLLQLETLSNYPYFRHVGGDGPIVVEDIREVKQFLTLKTAGKANVRRAVLIENADTMNDESQNALLKSLEEPPLDTVIILTASDAQQLRSTIISRVRVIDVLPPRKTELEGFFTQQGYSTAQIDRAYSISDGLVGLMTALLGENETHPLVLQITQAKQLLAVTSYERLARVDEFAKQKQTTMLLIEALKLITTSAMRQAALKGQNTGVERWRSMLTAISEAELGLRHNANQKLLLTNLFLSIS